VCNGLLLRADMHVLFDLGLVTISGDHRVVVSERLKGRAPLVEGLHGAPAHLGSKRGVIVSSASIGFHSLEVFDRV
jgi:putative restriction endonuclease